MEDGEQRGTVCLARLSRLTLELLVLYVGLIEITTSFVVVASLGEIQRERRGLVLVEG